MIKLNSDDKSMRSFTNFFNFLQILYSIIKGRLKSE